MRGGRAVPSAAFTPRVRATMSMHRQAVDSLVRAAADKGRH
jgi:hypothetical protein